MHFLQDSQSHLNNNEMDMSQVHFRKLGLKRLVAKIAWQTEDVY